MKRKQRAGNPLSRRVFRELRDEWRKYAVIFVFLTATIAFVAGMYVANNSMLTEAGQAREKYLREDGHFELSEQADPELLAAIESGERADLLEYYTEQAHREIDEVLPGEVEAAVTEEVTAAVSAQAEEAIRAQAREQGQALGLTGQALEELEQAAVDENLEAAEAELLPGALEQAMESEEYEEALETARETAYADAEQEIDEAYRKAAERYRLDDPDFEPVPVTVYPFFYRDLDEDHDHDGVRDGGIRVYREPKDVNLYCLMDGKGPESEDEILIDRMHADNAGIRVGDIISVGSADFRVCGLAAFSNYSTLYERNTDVMFDALTFDVAVVTEEGYARFRGAQRYAYAWRYRTAPADEIAEKQMSDHFLEALITQTAAAENGLEDFVPGYANMAITFAPEDMGSDKAMGGVILDILVVVLAFIFAITISSTIAREAPVIGTLRASGYTRGELLRHYMSMPVLVTLISAVAGNLLGYTVFKNIVVAMYYNSYSLPAYTTVWTPDAFVKTTVIPVILMLAVNLLVISRKLRLSPLRFLRRDLKTTRRKKAVRLPSWQFIRRFRMRIFLQNLPNYLVLLIGILFVMVMLAMAVGLPDTLSWYQGKVPEMMFARHQVILTASEDENGDPITTGNPDAEAFCMTSLLRRSESRDESVSVYGISEGSRYMPLDRETGTGEVWVSAAYAGKFRVRPGDTILLEEKYENRSYRFTVAGICDYDAAVAVFLSRESFNRTFDRDPDDFSGYFSNEEIRDIDEAYIASEITEEDLTKVSRQLDHSMGAYMRYFQYLCGLLAAVLIYLLTKIIIEKNESAISMVKILGYTDREIAGLYLVTTTLAVLASEAVSLVLAKQVMNVAWRAVLERMDGWFPFVISGGGIVKMFLMVFAAYLVIMLLDFRRIRRIPMDRALKDAE